MTEADADAHHALMDDIANGRYRPRSKLQIGSHVLRLRAVEAGFFHGSRGLVRIAYEPFGKARPMVSAQDFFQPGNVSLVLGHFRFPRPEFGPNAKGTAGVFTAECPDGPGDACSVVVRTDRLRVVRVELLFLAC